MNEASAIVDTGTTLILIPTSAFNALQSASGGTVDSESGLLKFKTKPTENFSITVGGLITGEVGLGDKFSLTPNQYLIPETQ